MALSLIKIKGAHSLLYVLAQSLPSVPLGKNVLRQTFRAEAPVLLLRHLENQFIHVLELSLNTDGLTSGQCGSSCLPITEPKGRMPTAFDPVYAVALPSFALS